MCFLVVLGLEYLKCELEKASDPSDLVLGDLLVLASGH